jgi:hypothetical protein
VVLTWEETRVCRADAFLCPFGDVVYIQVLGWGEGEGSSFAQVSCSGLNIHRRYIQLGALAEVEDPAKLASQVEYSPIKPFWITGKVGVLLSTSEIVYEWPPLGWRVPWWPTSLAAQAKGADDGQLQRVNSLLAELDHRIRQEEREAQEARRVRRLSSGEVSSGEGDMQSSARGGDGRGQLLTARQGGVAAGLSETQGVAPEGAEVAHDSQNFKILLPNFHPGSYYLNEHGQLVRDLEKDTQGYDKQGAAQAPVEHQQGQESEEEEKEEVKEKKEDKEQGKEQGDGMAPNSESARDKSRNEAQIEAFCPWLALANSSSADTPAMVSGRLAQDQPKPCDDSALVPRSTSAGDLAGNARHDEEEECYQPAGQADVDADVAASAQHGSWSMDMIFLFEMFPDVDPSRIKAQLLECGDDLQKVADVLLLSQSGGSSQLDPSLAFLDHEDLLQYELGYHLEEEEERQAQIISDHQIAADYELAFKLDDEDAGMMATRAGLQGPGNWAGKVHGERGLDLCARQRREQMQQMHLPKAMAKELPLDLDFVHVLGAEREAEAPRGGSQVSAGDLCEMPILPVLLSPPQALCQRFATMASPYMLVFCLPLLCFAHLDTSAD